MRNGWSCSSLNDKQRVATRWWLSTNQLGSKLQLYTFGWWNSGFSLSSIRPNPGKTSLRFHSHPCWGDLGLTRHENTRDFPMQKGGICKVWWGGSTADGPKMKDDEITSWKLAVCPSKLVVGRLRTFLLNGPFSGTCCSFSVISS